MRIPMIDGSPCRKTTQHGIKSQHKQEPGEQCTIASCHRPKRNADIGVNDIDPDALGPEDQDLPKESEEEGSRWRAIRNKTRTYMLLKSLYDLISTSRQLAGRIR
jgi:hypothetical protein